MMSCRIEASITYKAPPPPTAHKRGSCPGDMPRCTAKKAIPHLAPVHNRVQALPREVLVSRGTIVRLVSRLRQERGGGGGRQRHPMPSQRPPHCVYQLIGLHGMQKQRQEANPSQTVGPRWGGGPGGTSFSSTSSAGSSQTPAPRRSLPRSIQPEQKTPCPQLSPHTHNNG